MDTTTLDRARYVALTTFRADGTPRPTPVWFAGAAGRYVVVTDPDSFKVRRLRADGRVELAPCDARGRTAPGTVALPGRGRVLDQPEDAVVAAEAVEALRRRYGWQWRAFGAARRLRSLVGRSAVAPMAVLELTVDGTATA